MRWFAAVAALACVGCGRGHQQSPPLTIRPDILLVTIDTWRADRLRPDLTPNLSALAAAGLTFTNARSAVPLTLPSHTTILTGLLPPAHGVRENGRVLGEAHPTVATILKRGGYRTAAFIGAFVLDRRFGLARGFDQYDDRIPRDPNAMEKLDAERPASAVVDSALAWLDAAPTDQPFFLWVHVYDPHAPYAAHGGRAVTADERYDEEVSFVDGQLSRLFRRLRERPRFNSTAIVICGDHGEGLGEHGENTHGMLVYDSTLRVPLVIIAPGVKPATRTDAVSLVSIARTLLEFAGVADAGQLPKSLITDPAAPQQGSAAVDLYAETEYPRVAGWSPVQMLTDGRWKVIRAGQHSEIYDVSSDPRESQNAIARQSGTVAAMAARIAAIHAPATSSSAPQVSAEAAERLRALGYVASSSATPIQPNAPNPATFIADWNAFEQALGDAGRDVRRALPNLKRLADGHPDAPVFQTTYAKALKDAGQSEAALARYRSAARRWPTDATLLHDLAVAARDAGQLDEARNAEEAALALEPESPTAHNGLGLLAVDQNRLTDAVRAFSAAARLDPNNASYWINLGNASHQLQDSTDAERAYRRALDVDPASPDAANGLGVLLVEAKRPGEAIQWFERALKRPPAFAEAQLNLGIALQESGNPMAAVNAYRAVLANPSAGARERAAAKSLLAALGDAR